MNTHLLASLLLCAGTLPAQATCTVYQHRDYGGAHWTLGPADEMQMGGGEPIAKQTYDGPNIGQIYYRPDWNDQISSFKVTGGCNLTLWQHASTQGYGPTFKSSTSYRYVGDRWNDQASWAFCDCPLRR